jgi:hypothetical protein
VQESSLDGAAYTAAASAAAGNGRTAAVAPLFLL